MSTSSEMLTPTGTKTGYRNNDVKDMYLLSILGISKQVAAEGSPDTQEFNSYKLICTTSSDESALSKYALTKATWKKPNPKPKSPISYYVEPTHRTHQVFWSTINALSFWSLTLWGERQEQHTTTYHNYIAMLIFLRHLVHITFPEPKQK